MINQALKEFTIPQTETTLLQSSSWGLSKHHISLHNTEHPRDDPIEG